MVLIILLCVIAYILIGCVTYGIFDAIDGVEEGEEGNGNEWLIIFWPFVVVCVIPMMIMYWLYRLGKGTTSRIKNLTNKK